MLVEQGDILKDQKSVPVRFVTINRNDIGILVKDTKCFQDVIRFFFGNANIAQSNRWMRMM